MIVAIDGPAGSGKSTTARLVAERMGFFYLDTGAMYRAVALALIDTSENLTPESVAERLEGIHIELHTAPEGMRISLNGKDVTNLIRSPEIASLSSRISAFRPVREKLVSEQRRIALEYEARIRGVILDGRDIGTYVFPDADVKFFMVAEPNVRAQRRKEQLERSGTEVQLSSILREIQHRDKQDRERELAPLRKAEDAIEIDTTENTIEEQVNQVIAVILERTKGYSV